MLYTQHFVLYSEIQTNIHTHMYKVYGMNEWKKKISIHFFRQAKYVGKVWKIYVKNYLIRCNKFLHSIVFYNSFFLLLCCRFFNAFFRNRCVIAAPFIYPLAARTDTNISTCNYHDFFPVKFSWSREWTLNRALMMPFELVNNLWDENRFMKNIHHKKLFL